MSALAVADGTWVLLAAMLLLLAGLAYGLYTRRGSGIESRPIEGHGTPAAADGESGTSGHDEGEDSPFSSHGAK